MIQLAMKKTTLSNGLTIITEKKQTESITIQVNVQVGSNQEPEKIFGISHFIEHMLFEGTKNRENSTLIANEIERLGGELNAYTSNERTCFYIKVYKKHFLKALDVLADILQNPLFNPKQIEKERQIILKEINMVKDEPRFYQWVLFQKTLFKKHPSRNPTYGTVEAVKTITKKDLLNYYHRYYVPNNMVISVVGNLKNPESKVKKAFNLKNKKRRVSKEIKEPINKEITIKKEKRKILNSYVVLGYKTVKRSDKDSYVLDVIKALLARGQSGKIVEEVRNKRGLAYEINVHHESGIDYGFFAVYFNTPKGNISKVKDLILNQLNNLKDLSGEELKEALGYLEGQYILENEDTHDIADDFGFWEQIKDVKLAKEYIKNVKKTKKKDILKVSNKYFTGNYTMTVIEQK